MNGTGTIRTGMIVGSTPFDNPQDKTVVAMKDSALDELTLEDQVVQLKKERDALQQSQRELTAMVFNGELRWRYLCDKMLDYIRELEKKIKRDYEMDQLVREQWSGKRVEEYKIGR